MIKVSTYQLTQDKQHVIYWKREKRDWTKSFTVRVRMLIYSSTGDEQQSDMILIYNVT